MKNFLRSNILPRPKVAKEVQKPTFLFFGLKTPAQKSRDGSKLSGQPDTSGFPWH